MKVIVASRNKGKVAEIRQILSLWGVEVVPLSELPALPDVEETGTSFAENAIVKARTVACATGLPAISDDSGIEVDYLGGFPGVHSARFAGLDATDEEKNRIILDKLAGVPVSQRGAGFRCAAAFAAPDGRVVGFEGGVRGFIADEPRGFGGFGYDPIFFYPPYGRTFGEVSAEMKNKVSHRGRAFRLLADFFRCSAQFLDHPRV
ncbi:MAG: XTP/dITP diphosphatase [Planctomycetota bacterium]